MKLGLVALLLLSATPVSADGYSYSPNEVCEKTIYREQYVEGTLRSSGYVRSFRDTIEIPCHRTTNQHQHRHNHYHSRRKCNSSRTTGGLLGGGIAAALSDRDSWAWSIPVGAVVGMGAGGSGCQ